MIDVSYFDEKSDILLVGEGNFTFTISLLFKIVRKLSVTLPASSNIIATCFQKYSDLPDQIKQNAHHAYKSGAEIWFGVDATNLHVHERFKDCKFDAIIFNFPHVGGKMKLHLNRLLLKNFFLSSSVLLKERGKILVTLCQGQSGTPYDVVKRKHGDSWQIIDMANHADLILGEVYPFSPNDWHFYNSNGYRGLDKGFNLHGAHTFEFIKAPLASLKSLEATNQQDFGCQHCPYVQDQLAAVKEKLFDIAHHLNTLLEENLEYRKICQEVEHLCLCWHQDPSIDWWHNICGSKDNLKTIRCIFLCRPCWIEDEEPVKNIILITNVKSKCIQSLLSFLNSRCTQQKLVRNAISHSSITQFNDVDNELEVAILFEGKSPDGQSNSIVIYMDAFLQLGANFIKPGLVFPLEHCLKTKSLFPPTHSHHISFWVSDKYSHRSFSCALQHVAGRIVKNFKLIDQYQCSIEKRNSVCYQITYQSLDGALSSEKAFYLQTKVIGPFLESCLDVSLR